VEQGVDNLHTMLQSREKPKMKISKISRTKRT